MKAFFALLTAIAIGGCQGSPNIPVAVTTPTAQQKNDTAVTATYLAKSFWRVCAASAPDFGDKTRALLKAQDWTPVRGQAVETWARSIQATNGPLVVLNATFGPIGGGRRGCQVITAIDDPAAVEVAMLVEIAEDQQRTFDTRRLDERRYYIAEGKSNAQRWVLRSIKKNPERPEVGGLFATSME